MILPKIKSTARGLLLWTAASLVAILLLEYNALLGLASALVLGVLLGVLVFRDGAT